MLSFPQLAEFFTAEKTILFPRFFKHNKRGLFILKEPSLYLVSIFQALLLRDLCDNAVWSPKIRFQGDHIWLQYTFSIVKCRKSPDTQAKSFRFLLFPIKYRSKKSQHSNGMTVSRELPYKRWIPVCLFDILRVLILDPDKYPIVPFPWPHRMVYALFPTPLRAFWGRSREDEYARG